MAAPPPPVPPPHQHKQYFNRYVVGGTMPPQTAEQLSLQSRSRYTVEPASVNSTALITTGLGVHNRTAGLHAAAAAVVGVASPRTVALNVNPFEVADERDLPDLLDEMELSEQMLAYQQRHASSVHHQHYQHHQPHHLHYAPDQQLVARPAAVPPPLGNQSAAASAAAAIEQHLRRQLPQIPPPQSSFYASQEQIKHHRYQQRNEDDDEDDDDDDDDDGQGGQFARQSAASIFNATSNFSQLVSSAQMRNQSSLSRFERRRQSSLELERRERRSLGYATDINIVDCDDDAPSSDIDDFELELDELIVGKQQQQQAHNLYHQHHTHPHQQHQHFASLYHELTDQQQSQQDQRYMLVDSHHHALPVQVQVPTSYYASQQHHHERRRTRRPTTDDELSFEAMHGNDQASRLVANSYQALSVHQQRDSCLQASQHDQHLFDQTTTSTTTTAASRQIPSVRSSGLYEHQPVIQEPINNHRLDTSRLTASQQQLLHGRMAAGVPVAMGSDSELNMRGLSSKKLYYVHVPPPKRNSRRRNSQAAQIAQQQQQQSQQQELLVEQQQQQQQQQQHNTREALTVPQRDKHHRQHHGHQQHHGKSRSRGRHVDIQVDQQQIVDSSEYLHQRQQQVTNNNRTSSNHDAQHHEQAAIGNTAPVPKGAKVSKGVTFDGRTSAPIYPNAGERKSRRQTDEYLRTHSEEQTRYKAHGTSQHDAGKLLASSTTGHQRDSSASYLQYSGADISDFDERDLPAHPNQLYLGGSHTSALSGNQQLDLIAANQHQSKTNTCIQDSSALMTTSSEFNISSSGVSAAASNVSRGPYNAGSSLDSWAVTGHSQTSLTASTQRLNHPKELGITNNDHQHSIRHSTKQYSNEAGGLSCGPGGGSISDTGAASLSDKDASQATISCASGQLGPTNNNRGDRKMRNKDSQQSSYERSVGNGGSSQSLKSGGETGGGIRSGNHAGHGLSKKSNSTTQLSLSGTKKRLGFRKKQVTLFSVHRSEEVVPHEARHLVKQTTSFSSDGEGSLSNDSGAKFDPNDTAASFVDGLGAGQIVSRQALASRYLGDIQLSLCDRKGSLEVEVIRARRLHQKPNTKHPPSPYVKVYLMKNRKCIAKAKTGTIRRTLDPLFQQQLTFREDYRKCILQIIVWGEYNRLDNKALMGIVQIQLDDLNLSSIVIGWYKLFNPSSMTTLPSKSLRHSILSSSTQSFT